MNAMLLFDVSAALETLGHRHGDHPFLGIWEEIHWMNTPGPLYCSDTDNCGTGPVAAPDNVEVDGDGFEVLYRQPINLFELHQVIQATERDTFHNYGMDGNQHWSYEMIKVWWAEPRQEIEQEVKRLYEYQGVHGTRDTMAFPQRWLNYFQEGLYSYLQAYAFFLDTGRLPMINDRLPAL